MHSLSPPVVIGRPVPPPVLPHSIARGNRGIASAGSAVKDRGPLLRLASLVLDGGPGSGRVSIYAGHAVGKNLIPILKAFGSCLPLTRA